MDLSAFARYKIEFERRARARKEERLNLGLWDGSWTEQVLEEMCVDFIQKLEAQDKRIAVLESILTPAE